MRNRLLRLVAGASVLLGVGNAVQRAWVNAPWRLWCWSAVQQENWRQSGTLRYGLDYAEMRRLLDPLPAKVGIWVEYSDPPGEFPMSEYYAQMLQFYGAPRSFYTRPEPGQVAYHLVLRNRRWVELKPWP